MRRSEFLNRSGSGLPRFKVLRQRNQLPFVIGANDAEHGGAGFTLDHAFRMRLMLDLVGGEDRASDPLGGLGPATAASIVSNAVGKFQVDPVDLARKGDWYLGVAVLDEPERDGRAHRFSSWVFCQAEELPAWLAASTAPGDDGLSRSVARVFLVNATRAARYVLSRGPQPTFPTKLVYLDQPEGDA